ncbi:hypothetical protein CO662_22000 [Rhizobium anhuiense]|uniref:Uncharacterized protein n=1 Tax=Rhizobium anhuiense TaxID=1184720 RepID=A0ABX4J4L6_9HYPH|nr:hypothetical protein [Rhizobium anhuiense]PDS49747.1 hypothetical protein CO662_22000 [Rhizobium anhuiense]
MPRDWRDDVAAVRFTPPAEAAGRLVGILAGVGGKPLGVRDARSRLFLISMDVLKGSPKMIEIEGGVVAILAVGDLAGILCDQSFASFREEARKAGRKVGRRRVVNR